MLKFILLLLLLVSVTVLVVVLVFFLCISIVVCVCTVLCTGIYTIVHHMVTVGRILRVAVDYYFFINASLSF